MAWMRVSGGLSAFWIVATAGLGQAALAGDGTSGPPAEVVVTATRVPVEPEHTGATVTVKTAAEIERKQERTLVEVLSDVPGINVVQSGGAGKLTSVFIRGAGSEHTLVLLDGIELNDPATANRTFDISSLLTEDIARVEIVRGPLSTVQGSDAIGGVINIITKRGEGPPKLFAEAEGGSFGTHHEAAGISGGEGGKSYAFTFNRLASDDISVTPANRRPPGAPNEPDGFRDYNVSTRLGYTPTESLDLDFVGRYINTWTATDNSAEDPDSHETTQRYFVRGQAKLSMFDGMLIQTAGAAYSWQRRHARDVPDAVDPLDPNDFTVASNETLRGRLTKFDYQASLLLDMAKLTVGAERKHESTDQKSSFTDTFGGVTIGDFDAATGSTATFAEAQLDWMDRAFLTANVRVDMNDDFGTQPTWRLAPVYVFASTGTRIKGSYGTAFKAPTLFQLYGVSTSPFGVFRGNPNLGPETSKGWEAGFEQPLLGGKLRLGSTYFHNDIKGLIVSNDTFTSVVNVGSAETYGVESFIRVTPSQAVAVGLDHTWLVAEDATTGQELLRRPKHKVDLNVRIAPTKASTVSLEGVWLGPQADIDSVLFTRIRSGGYFVANLAGTYTLDDRIRLFGRIDNMFDRDYQNPDGFQHRGIGVFVGLRATFGPL